ncbi:MAG TPA: thiamine pyrophosphate-dependent dehydrogenase E1 component subunit alpha [Candidatus Hydrogenedentes bacterium]|nr:thiamine pyrophosphate-dependent dehydrogenase E1 component subunit alpha [Candidatus Hydrogenedentota bacterium]HQM48183.1 thiamine pyrophosphate-dependent dehydrogenase E1 component subunit alpha [Candidatus Hydrogenedentota bacterium]
MDNHTKIQLLKTMVRIRKAELQLAIMYKNGKVFCAAHLYEGEEAIAAGVCANLRADDCMTSTHRGHGHCIAKGMPMRKMIAEVCGKKTGCCGGKGGTMHLFDPAVGVMGTVGIVGGGIPLSTGLGLAMKMQKTDRVAVSFFGDGASNNGAFHESLNLAALWKLPVIYVCENNMYATSVAVWRSTSVPDIGVRGAAYGIPGVTVDGNRVDEVYAAAAEAVSRARAGLGPMLIECKTYRIRGHFEGDDSLYRTKEEVAEARKRDPIDYWKGKLLGDGVITEEVFTAINEEADAEVADAALFAEQSPFPAPEEALILTAQA